MSEHMLSGRLTDTIPRRIIECNCKSATHPFLLIASLRHQMICKPVRSLVIVTVVTLWIKLAEMFAKAIKELCFHLTLSVYESKD